MAEPVENQQATCDLCGSPWHTTDNHDEVHDMAIGGLVGVPGVAFEERE